MGNDVIAKHARDFLAACEKSTMNDQQQSRADALTIPRDLLNDLIDDVQSFADQVPCREREKAFRADLLARARAIAAFPVEQPALLTAQDALAAIETFEIVGDNNDSREPNAEDRFILTEFVAHLFGGFRVELPAAAPASANETGAEGPAIELLRKFMEYRDSDYVPNVLFDCARTIIDNAMAAAALADETPEGCTPADARMLREANHALAAENDALRRALRPFARVVSTDKLSWAMVEYCVEGDPEKQTFQAPQMQRAFNRAADILRAEPAQPAAAPADGACKRCGSTTAQACNDAGCFYLESGDGEPSAAPTDERAASWHCEDPVQKCSAQCDSCAKQARATTEIADERAECIAWANANGFPKYHESMCAAWEERARRAAASTAQADERAAFDLAEFCELIDAYQCAQKDGTHDERAKARFALMNAYRAAASLAAEAVAFEVTEEIAADWAKRHDIEHVLKHHSTQRNAIEDARTLHLIDAPQPAHAEAASPAAEEMRDAAMRTVQAMGLVYTPGSDRWRPNPNHAPAAAAASPAAEVVRLQHVATAEDGGKLRWMTGRRPRDCELYAMPDGGRAPATLYTAPQPAQADAPAEARADALALLMERDAWKNTMQGLCREWFATPDAAAAHLRARLHPECHAPAEAREALNEVLFGNDEALEMASDALDRLGQDSAAAGVRAVAYELRMLAHKMRCAPADAGEAVPIAIYQVECGIQQGQVTYRDADKAEYDERQPSSRRIVYTAPPAARVASLTDEHRSALEYALSCIEKHGYESGSFFDDRAKYIRALLNGTDKS